MAKNNRARTSRGDPVLEWIGEAQAGQRTWARNTLALVGAIAVLFWLAMRFGLLAE